eukprot:s3717_g13.t2
MITEVKSHSALLDGMCECLEVSSHDSHDLSFTALAMGGGKGKKGWKGGPPSKGTGKGLGFQVHYGPILEAPPLYAQQPMSHVPKACELRGAQEANLITSHRRLLHFWKTSPYYIHKADKSRKWRLTKSATPSAEDQLVAIVKAGGLSHEHFPVELQTRSLLRAKGKTAEKQVLDALKRSAGIPISLALRRHHLPWKSSRGAFAMAMSMAKSTSLPGLWKMGTEKPRGLTGNEKKVTLAFKVGGDLGSAVDRKKGPASTKEHRELAGLLKTAGWRMMYTEKPEEPPPAEEEMIPRNMRHPREAPAWLKHDKQVLRFYGFFQETVTERPDENARYRHVSIMFHMEDGTMSMHEPKVENSGLAQGPFLKRQKVMREDGMAYLGPDDLKVGQEITIYGRTIHINGCDRFTRWFFEQNGVWLPPEEPVVEDQWQKSYKLKKMIERGEMPLSRASVDAKHLAKYMSGAPHVDMKFTQFALNERTVLRFKAYWDDHTPYGARIYFIIHYFLADNTVEINEAHCRNSGRDPTPMFMKRGPLSKKNQVLAVPGLLAAEGQIYYPHDFRVGQSINVWGRKLVIYDCDDATEKFYKQYMDIDQREARYSAHGAATS